MSMNILQFPSILPEGNKAPATSDLEDIWFHFGMGQPDSCELANCRFLGSVQPRMMVPLNPGTGTV